MHPDRHVRLILAVFAIAAALLVSRTSGGWQLGLLLAVVVMVVGELRLGGGTTAAHALTDESLQAQDADAVADEPVAAQPSGANPFLTTTARLAAQQVALLDRLQADERDPDRLADLFEMDHLNAMIRQAAALAVIADGGSAPALDGLDAPHIGDVVLGAKARTNHYSRVTLEDIEGVFCHPHAAEQLVVVLTELLTVALSARGVVKVSGYLASENTYLISMVNSGSTSTDTEVRNLTAAFDPATPAAPEMSVSIAASVANALGVTVRASLENGEAIFFALIPDTCFGTETGDAPLSDVEAALPPPPLAVAPRPDAIEVLDEADDAVDELPEPPAGHAGVADELPEPPAGYDGLPEPPAEYDGLPEPPAGHVGLADEVAEAPADAVRVADELPEPPAGFDGLPEPPAGFDGLPEPPAGFDGLPEPPAGYDGLPEPPAGYDGLPEPPAGYDGLPEPPAGYDGLPEPPAGHPGVAEEEPPVAPAPADQLYPADRSGDPFAATNDDIPHVDIGTPERTIETGHGDFTAALEAAVNPPEPAAEATSDPFGPEVADDGSVPDLPPPPPLLRPDDADPYNAASRSALPSPSTRARSDQLRDRLRAHRENREDER